MRSTPINCGIDAFPIKVERLCALSSPWSSRSSQSSMYLATSIVPQSSKTVSLSRDGSQIRANACEWSRTDRIDARYLKRKSAAIPARHAFSNVPRVGTVIDKTIRKLPRLSGNYRRKSQVGAKHDFRSNRLCVFSREIKEKPICSW